MRKASLILACVCTFFASSLIAAEISNAGPVPHATTAGGSHQLTSLEGCMNQWLFNGVWRIRVTNVAPITLAGVNRPGYAVTIQARNGTNKTESMAFAGVQDSHLVLVDGTDLQLDTDATIAWHVPFYKDLLPSSGFSHTLNYYSDSTNALAKPQKWILPIDPSKNYHLYARYSTANPSLRVNLTCSK